MIKAEIASEFIKKFILNADKETLQKWVDDALKKENEKSARIKSHKAAGLLNMPEKDIKRMLHEAITNKVKLQLDPKGTKFKYNEDKNTFDIEVFASNGFSTCDTFIIFRVFDNLDIRIINLSDMSHMIFYNQIKVREILNKYTCNHSPKKKSPKAKN